MGEPVDIHNKPPRYGVISNEELKDIIKRANPQLPYKYRKMLIDRMKMNSSEIPNSSNEEE